LVAVLAATDPSTPMWAGTDRREVSFWARRQAHEVAVHRWDAQSAAGSPEPIEAPVAADGIDEFLGLLPYWRGEPLRGDGETVHVHCTDVAGEWLVRLTPAGPYVAREHAKGDVAARGSASDLALFLRRRVGADALDVFGDAALLERFRDAATV
jgi:uncharacterized protein (TIGR03083 family)